MERWKFRGNNGKLRVYYQKRAWLLSCGGHFPDSSLPERVRIKGIIEEMLRDLSGDDEPPPAGHDENQMKFALERSAEAFSHFMGLFEYDTHEELAVVFRQLGETMRDRRTSRLADDDESMEEEAEEERTRRYQECGMSEQKHLISTFWQRLHYGPPFL